MSEVPHDIVLIAKTKYGDSYCYLGWDMGEERIRRPIPDGKNFWPLEQNYDVGRAYNFTSKHIAKTLHPEDIVVSGEMSINEENPMPNMFNNLQAIASDSVEDIWPNIIEEGKFVRENDYLNHHSTGILKCKRANLNGYPDPGEHRVGREGNTHQQYDFPLQAIDPNLPDMPEDEDVLVVLELGRPMEDPNDPSLPKRCYILATGLLTERKLHIIVLIAKTVVSNGYCYLGWDMGENRIRRPIPDRSDGNYYWPKDPKYDVGKAYEFTSKGIAQKWFPPTPEDIGVSGEMSIIEENPIPNIFANLLDIAKNSVEEIWPNIIEERKFIRANHYSKHHSTGILKCQRANLKVPDQHAGKTRILIYDKYIDDQYDFPWKAIDPNLPDIPKNEDVLVVLGLARPMDDKKDPSLPGRCYIMATGLLTS